jgi:hypothetical protein
VVTVDGLFFVRGLLTELVFRVHRKNGIFQVGDKPVTGLPYRIDL